jgi:acyl-CoA thioester hydrolase
MFSFDIRVYYEDTDAGGIVYYANYLRFMERARTEWLRALGVNLNLLAQTSGVQFVVRRVNLDFVAAARLDDMLSVSVRPTHFARTYADLEQWVTLADRIICKAQLTLACVRHADLKPAAIPDAVILPMKQFADGAK